MSPTPPKPRTGACRPAARAQGFARNAKSLSRICLSALASLFPPGGLRLFRPTLALPLLVVLLATTAALPATGCIPSCDNPTTALAFTNAAIILETGASVTWTAIDTAHTVTSADTCLAQFFVSSVTVRFDIVNDTLMATAPGKLPAACDGATPLPDGSLMLEYKCALHPQQRHGYLIVKP